MTTQGLPKAIRLNNPGNIERDGDKWQGMAPDQPDDRFIKFVTPEYGIRAIVKIWMSYRRRDKDVLTVAEVVHQWAPPSENKTDKYVQNVCQFADVTPGTEVLFTAEFLGKLIPAFVRQEAGYCPYSQDVIKAGVKLAIGK